MVIDKECTTCSKKKPINRFGILRSSIDGRRGRCKDCRKVEEKNRLANEASKYPAPNSHCVYAFKKGNEVVYIGESSTPSFRIYEHFNKTSEKSIFQLQGVSRFDRELNYTWHILWHGKDRADARHQEKMNIQVYQPKFNQIKYKSYEG